VKYFRDSTKL